MDIQEGRPLFESRKAKSRVAYRVFAATIFAGICMIWVYRIVYMPKVGEEGRWVWLGMLLCEFCFSLYWICTQAVRWTATYTQPFKDRLSQRYKDDMLPHVDVFVCTADPIMEPPNLVINTIFSVMSFNYPTQKLSVYLSDDAGSEFTFYALLEASHFSKYWIPFCKTHQIEPRSPAAYFALHPHPPHTAHAKQWLTVKTLYEEMKHRIETSINSGSIPEKVREQHKGFSEWDHKVTKSDHQAIVQIIIDGRDAAAVDNSGCGLPTLVYMAREKRPQHPHNFKAGAMNALTRVSSVISNGSIVLNLDCDMYANDSDAIREALCFFMDEEKGHQIAFVQHPQAFDNVTKNDLYANTVHIVNKVELARMGGLGAALYCGTGCFHRRESLCGKNYSKDEEDKWKVESNKSVGKTDELEETSKVFASCTYEQGTQWGKETILNLKMGLVYGCPVEDIATGLTIQGRGWKSVYHCPQKEAFLGVAPDTLDVALIQYKRWCEGMFQIFISKYCPFIAGHGKLNIVAQMGYCIYLLWAPLSLPTLYYVIVPPLCLLRGIPLFPQVSSLWFITFAYVFTSRNAFSIAEGLSCGYTVKGWWNLQRMVMIRRTTAYFFAFIDAIIKQLGLSASSFALTAKVITEDVKKRYEQEIMEFGSSSITFTIIATLAMLNLLSFAGAIIKGLIWVVDSNSRAMLIPQFILCGLVIMVNIPVYQALFLRTDNGRLPTSVVFKSIALASLACLMAVK